MTTELVIKGPFLKHKKETKQKRPNIH